jgi:cytosine deaminase
VVIGENRTFHGGQDWLELHGVRITMVDDAECVAMMTDFIATRPDLWFEDIGQDTAP